MSGLRSRPKHWRFEKDYSKLTLSQLTILALRAFPSSPHQLRIKAEIDKRYAKGEKQYVPMKTNPTQVRRNPGLEPVEYTLPAYWASYLINNDDSGLDAKEKAQVDAFLKRHNLPMPVSCSDESYFSKHNDAGTLTGDVLDYTFLLPAKRSNPIRQARHVPGNGNPFPAGYTGRRTVRGNPPWSNYSVIVGNIGTVYDGPNEKEAKRTYNEYLSQSKQGYGRAAGESVTIMRKGEIIREHVGTVDSFNDDEPKQNPKLPYPDSARVKVFKNMNNFLILVQQAGHWDQYNWSSLSHTAGFSTCLTPTEMVSFFRGSDWKEIKNVPDDLFAWIKTLFSSNAASARRTNPTHPKFGKLTLDQPELDEDEKSDAYQTMRDDIESGEAAIINDNRSGGYSLIINGKRVGNFESIDKAAKASRNWMKQNNFYPSMYYVNERGNVDLLTAGGRIITSWV